MYHYFLFDGGEGEVMMKSLDASSAADSYTVLSGFVRDSVFVPTDVNECDEKDVCGNGVCSNTVGSFACRCEEGYSVKLDSGPACTDEDECEMGTHRCDMNAACINNPVTDDGEGKGNVFLKKNKITRSTAMRTSFRGSLGRDLDRF